MIVSENPCEHRAHTTPPPSSALCISLGWCGKSEVNAARKLNRHTSDGTNPSEEVRGT